MSAFVHSYARSFLETAPAGYDVAKFLESAGSLARAISGNPSLRAFVSAPAIPRAAKTETLAKLAEKAGIDPFGQRFFQVMLENRRLLQAEPILQAIREAEDARQGIVEGRVVVASPISEEERKTIEGALANRMGGKVRLEVEIEPAILAGFVAHVGSHVFDGSAATEIERFQEKSKGRTGA